MKSSNGWLGRMFLVAALFVAAPVWADEPTTSVAEAESVYNQAKRLADEGQWPAALLLFEKAYAKDPSPKRAAHLGRAQVMTERYAEGATNLQRYLSEERDMPVDVRAAVEELLRHAKTKVATVTLKVDPSAKVRIDEQEVPPERLFWPQYVKPGKRVFEVSKDGFVTTTDPRELGEGQVVDALELRVGEAVKGGRKPATGVVTHAPDKRWVIAGGVASGAFILAGIGMGVATKSRNDEAANAVKGIDCTGNECRRRYKENYNASTGLAIGCISSLVAASALATATIMYAVKGSTPADSGDKPTVSWRVVPTLGGFVVQGAF